MFASLTPQNKPHAKNGLRHYLALPTHRPKQENSNRKGRKRTAYHIEHKFVEKFLKNEKYQFKIKLYLCIDLSRHKNSNSMMFIERIKQLREERQMPQRQFAAALEIDTSTYCKIEKGERRVKREQVLIIAELLKADKDELLTLWIADQVTAVVEDDEGLSDDVLRIAKQNLNK